MPDRHHETRELSMFCTTCRDRIPLYSEFLNRKNQLVCLRCYEGEQWTLGERADVLVGIGWIR